MLYATSTLPASQELRVVPVAIYTRVSTDGQTGHRFDSCEHQANVCRDFIGNNCAAGWFEFGYFSDEAYSGATLDRPGIRRLMQCIAAGQVRVLLIYRLERILRSLAIDTLLICGTKTNICCESTARDAMMLDFKVVMVSDGTAALSDEEHRMALENVIQQFGDVLTTDEIVARLVRG